jgi:hypothetical protein
MRDTGPAVPNRPVPEELADLAGRYARAELDAREAAAFEDLLAADQAVRDALCAAVAGAAVPPPDPSYRRAVRRRLGVDRPRWHRLFARRWSRGHPLVWAAAGAAAAVLCLLPLTAPDPGPESPPPRPAPVAAVPPAERPPAPVPAADAEARDAEAARLWSERETSDRLSKALAEENRRKARSEDRRLAREERGARLFGPHIEKP